MKIYELVDILQSRASDLEDDAEVLVRDAEGWLVDFTITDTEAFFDGFDGYFPAGLAIEMVSKETSDL